LTTYIIRRVIMAIVVLVLVSTVVFLAMRMLPGDPIRLIMAQSEVVAMDDTALENLRHEFGLDRPLIVQYFSWVGGVLKGDFGTSIMSRNPVAHEMWRRLPITLHIGLVAFIIGLVIGIPAGILCAVKRGRWADGFVTGLANIGITVPVFWLGVMMIYVFALYLKWLPTSGYTSPFVDFWLSTKRLIMPVFCLALFPLAGTVRQTRSSMLEVLGQDYVRTAWSKGLKQKAVIMRHSLKNSLIPVVTLSGMQLTMVVGGAVIVEKVFNIPGLGRYLIDSINAQDYPAVQSAVLLIAIIVVVINLLIDLSYGWLDPRIRYN
jgi:peptide/nickel transport system permease protein